MAARPPPTNRPSSMSIPRQPLPSLEDIMAAVSPTNTRTTSSSVSIHRQQPSSSVPSGSAPSHSPAFPRIIRANNASGSPPAQSPTALRADIACTPPPSSSPTRARRPSAGPLSLRSPTLHRPGSHTHVTLSSPHLALHQSPPPFPRPAYLEHSSLRHLLRTELPPNLPPSRYTQSTIYPFVPHHQHTSATPAPMDDSDDAESTVASPSPGRPPTPPASATTKSPNETVTLVSSSPVFRLPTRWSEQDRHTFLSVSSDGRELTYQGNFQNGGSTDNAGLARTNHPIPPTCGIYYYEIEILSKAQKAHISIGFAAGDTRLNKLPGWEKNSWGYHGDDGYSFSAEKAGSTYGPTFGGGDTIGAGIDFSQNRAFFTKNGSLIGMVFEHVACDVPVFPSVGLRHSNEHIRVNFGHSPFKYDIDDHVQQRRDIVWTTIQGKPLDWRILDPGRDGAGAHASRAADADGPSRTATESEGRDEAAHLVLNYLIHHGYAKTAEALQTQLSRSPARAASPALPVPPPASALAPPPDVDSPMLSADHDNEGEEPNMLEKRLSIVRAVRRGDVEGALHDLERRFPAVLARDGRIMRLKLRCRQFIELVNAAAEAKRAFSAAAASSYMAEDVDAMDVDDDAPAQAALKAALLYGRVLRAEYKKEATERPEVHALLERTWSVIAYHFPVEAGGDVGRWAGQDARDVLAGEVNQAILESQGFPARPALERIYRHTGACLVQLGFLGVGAAVFADLQRELLD